MSDDIHKSAIISLVEDLMSSIDSKPLHPKNKLLLYSRYVLSKLSWDFTISNIPQTWIKQNIDSLVNSYIRRWLEIPVSGTLSTIFITRNKFGLNIIPPSVKFLQSSLPKNIFSFSIRYINNSLPTGQNLARESETLLHVVAGCISYLDRFTWRHDSVVNFLAKTLMSVNDAKVYADLPGYKGPSIITGDEYRPDMLLLTSQNTLYVAQLTVGHESNLENNSNRKKQKYYNLVKELKDI